MFSRQETSFPEEENVVLEVADAPEDVEMVEEAPEVQEVVAVEPEPVPVPETGNAYPGVAALSVGQQNDSVRKVQSQLSAKGFAVTVNGDYDRATENAVASFCKSKGFHSNGTSVGPKAWKHLFG